MTAASSEGTMTAPVARRRGISPAVALIAGVVLLQLLLVWSVRYFPSQDGPVHLEGARNLLQWLRGDELVRHYYEIRGEPLPNYFSHLVLAAAMTVVSPLVAQKLLISGYAILFPLAVLYAVRSVRRDADAVALLALPLSFNYLLHAGFFNFCYATAFSLLAVGYYLRHRERFGWRQMPVLAGLGLLMFTAHLVPLMLAGLAIGILAMTDLFMQWRRREVPAWRRVLLPPVALLPFALLTIPYLDRSRMAGDTLDTGIGVVELTERLLVTASVASFDRAEAYVGVMLGGLLAAAVLYVLWHKWRRRLELHDGLLLFLLAGVAMYYTFRDGHSVDLWVPDRLNLYLHLALLVWLAGYTFGRRWRWTLAAAGVAAAVALAGLHARTYLQVQREIGEMTSAAAAMEPGRTLLPLIYAPQGRNEDDQPISYKLAPLAHAGGYVAVEGGVLNLTNYEGFTDHFPMIYRRHLDPLRLMDPAAIYGPVPTADLSGYDERTQGAGRVDYVLLYAQGPELAAHRHVVALREQLERDYRLAFTSPHGRVVLWERQSPPTPAQ